MMDTAQTVDPDVAPAESKTDPAGLLSWLRLVVTFFVLLLCSWLGIVLSRQSKGVATIWLTNGMLFALVITRPRSWWIRYFIAGFLADTLADVLYGDPLRLSAGVAAANSVEVILSC